MKDIVPKEEAKTAEKKPFRDVSIAKLKDPRTMNPNKDANRPVEEAKEEAKTADKKPFRDVSDAKLKDPRKKSKSMKKGKKDKHAAKKEEAKKEESKQGAVAHPPKGMKKKVHEARVIYDAMAQRHENRLSAHQN